MAKYTYEATWHGRTESGDVEMMYPEVIEVFNHKGLAPTEVSVVTKEGIHITWRISDD